jgi:glutathione S-transferase
VALREKGLAAELVETLPWSIGEEFLALNPAGEVPVLADGERAVCDSQAIAEYLDEAYPETSLLGRTIEQRCEIRRLVAWFDSKFAREVTDLLWREKLVKRWKRQGFPRSEALREVPRTSAGTWPTSTTSTRAAAGSRAMTSPWPTSRPPLTSRCSTTWATCPGASSRVPGTGTPR